MNGKAAYIRGFEVALVKRTDGVLSFRATWSSQWTAWGNMGVTQWLASVVPDSNFIASPAYWNSFQPQADGSETPVLLTEPERAALGTQVNQQVRTWADAYRRDPLTSFGTIPEYQDLALLVRYTSLNGARYGPFASGGSQSEKMMGRRTQGNVQVFLNTPPHVLSGSRWKGRLISSLSVNLLWKIRSGRLFWWTTPKGRVASARGPIDTVTDLSVEKLLNTRGRVRLSVFTEVRNLLNQRDDTDPLGEYTSTEHYMRWGLQMPPPDAERIERVSFTMAAGGVQLDNVAFVEVKTMLGWLVFELVKLLRAGVPALVGGIVFVALLWALKIEEAGLIVEWLREEGLSKIRAKLGRPVAQEGTES